MQTIFLATDSGGEFGRFQSQPRFRNGAWQGTRIDDTYYPPPGECREYRLVPVGGADDKDARIAELEKAVANADNRCVIAGESVKALESKLRDVEDCARELRQRVAERDNQLSLARGDCEVLRKAVAERSPGVMPAPVRELVEFVKRDAEDLVGPVMLAEAVERIYETPEGHEWQPVDDANPITAEDVGRMFCWGPTRIEHVFGNGPKFQAAIEGRYILRPVAPPFVFAGEPGRYVAKWEDDNETPEECEVRRSRDFPLCFIAYWSNDTWSPINADGTFSGGRIVGRVE